MCRKKLSTARKHESKLRVSMSTYLSTSIAFGCSTSSKSARRVRSKHGGCISFKDEKNVLGREVKITIFKGKKKKEDDVSKKGMK